VFFKGRRNSEQSRSTETEGQNEMRMERKGMIKETIERKNRERK
jgi:hypothetical protein